MTVQAWLEPTTVEEACDLLADDEWQSTPLAGGTAVSLMMRMGFLAPDRLVSLARVDGLTDITAGDDRLVIGAGVTLADVAEHPDVCDRLPSLAHACARVANVRVRNVATLGGNVAEADYASDPPAALASLGATCLVRGPAGRRELAIDELVVGHYTTTLEPGELITAVVVPTPSGRRATYLKYVTRSSEDRPCIGVAARVDLDTADPATADLDTAGGRGTGDAPDTHVPTVVDLDVVVGAVASTPQRVPEATAAAVGQPLDDAAADRLASAYTEAIDPIDDARGSSWYRTQMIGVFVRRAVRALAAGGAADG